MSDVSLWSWQLIGALILNGVVQMTAVGAFAARIAGVSTKRIAISISLFSLFAFASRLANLFYAPLLGTISDRTGNAVAAAIAAGSAALATPQVLQFEFQLRLIVLAGTVGTLVGAMFLPTFEYLFVRGIASFQRLDSVLRALFRLFDPRVVRAVVASFRLPNPARWSQYKLSSVPTKLLVAYTVVQSVYAIGVVAAVYASVRDPAFARTATLLSGIVNGIGTLAFTLFVDPTAAGIVDSAVHGKRTLDDVRAMVFWLTVTMVLGTLLSQVLLYPAATWSSMRPRGSFTDNPEVMVPRFASSPCSSCDPARHGRLRVEHLGLDRADAQSPGRHRPVARKLGRRLGRLPARPARRSLQRARPGRPRRRSGAHRGAALHRFALR